LQENLWNKCSGKRLFTALRAELYFEIRVIFTISLREIVKMTRISEEYSAAAGGKNLFTQPQNSLHNPSNKILRGEAADNPGK
jgi:hypothetical protein